MKRSKAKPNHSLIKRVHLQHLARQSIAQNISDLVGQRTLDQEITRLITNNHLLTLHHAVRCRSSDWIVQLSRASTGINPKEIYRLAREAWRLHAPGTARVWKQFFQKADQRLLMSMREHLVLASLPIEIPVFQPIVTRRCSCSLRWTLSREAAVLEARQSAFKLEIPGVWIGTCQKEDILAVFMFTEVPEFVIPPRRVRTVDIEVLGHHGVDDSNGVVAEETMNEPLDHNGPAREDQ